MKWTYLIVLSILFLTTSCTPSSTTKPDGKDPQNVIPMSVPDFTFIEKSDRVNLPFDGVEYWAYSLFEPQIDSEFYGKVLNLEVRVHKCNDETAAEGIFSAFAEGGTKQEEVQFDNINAMLTYDEDSGETAVFWRKGDLVILSDAIPPFEANSFNEQSLKRAALEGAKATAKNL
jgi:hypothetical protein